MLEPYRLFWLEDVTPAENQEAFRLIRQHTTTPLAVGEIFNTIWDCQGPDPEPADRLHPRDHRRRRRHHAPAAHRRPRRPLPGPHRLPRRHRPVAGDDGHGAALRPVEAWELLDEIRSGVQDFQPSTPAQLILYEQALERVHELADARSERLLDADHGLPAIVWIILIIGGVVVVGFTYLFGLESTVVHLFMVSALALIISLVLFTVAELEFPFRGGIWIAPEAMEQVLSRLGTSKLSGL